MNEQRFQHEANEKKIEIVYKQFLEHNKRNANMRR